MSKDTPLTASEEARKTQLFFKSRLTREEEQELYELMDRPSQKQTKEGNDRE
jgi:hypothetical protein